MATGFNNHQFQSTFEGADDHHLASDVVERHAEEGGVARLEAEKVVGATGRGEHTGLFDQHGLGSACRATGLHADVR